MKFQLDGIISAIVTPMNEDESVNFEELVNQIDRQVTAGADSIFCLGTNGEVYALTAAEKQRLITEAVVSVDGRCPVIAGTGAITTAETIEMSRYAAQAGCAAVAVITPYFAKLSQSDCIRHFEEVADNCDIPVLLYNMPARTGINLDVSTVNRLAQHPNIAGIKDSSGSFDNILCYIENTPKDFMVYSGNDQLILWTLMAGGNGGVSAVTNVLPETIYKIYHQFKNGDFQNANVLQTSIRELRNLFALGNPNTILKRACHLSGQPVGPARKPFGFISEAVDKQISEVVAHYINHI